MVVVRTHKETLVSHAIINFNVINQRCVCWRENKLRKKHQNEEKPRTKPNINFA